MSTIIENNNKPLDPSSQSKMAANGLAKVKVIDGPENGGPLSPSAKAEDLALLAKLDEENRKLEADCKARQTLTIHSNTSRHSSAGHSRQGSVSSILSNTSNYSNVSSSQPEDEHNPEDSWITWGKIVNDWENLYRRKQAYIKELVRKGVPHHFRGIVWQLLCNAHSSNSKEQYAEYLKMVSPCEKIIRRDITRTYPEHDFFKEKNGLGQESLFNVMKAYSLQDREVGYCQGSGFIVGLLLMQMPEEEAFAVLVKMMQEYKLRDLFKPSMAELGLCIFQLECMIQEHLAELYMHFQSQHICVSMFASSWFLTLFTTGLPLPVACRIFDVFLSEGMEIIFRVALAILVENADFLMCRDMEGVLKYLQKDMPARYENDPDTLLSVAYSVKYNPRKMKKLEKEYNALKTKEQEDQVELRRLRTENRLLRQRIDNLEKETATLADRLIQGQVIGAQKEEEIFVLRRELSTLKTRDAETSQKLDEVKQELTEVKRSNSVNSSSSAESQQEERIGELKREVSVHKEREHEMTCTIHELREKIRELENTNRQLQKDPNAEIQQLQEELIACKLREAEANLHMKELRQTVHDLDKHWQKHLEKWNQAEAAGQKPSKSMQQKLQEDLMTVRLREAESVADLKEMKQKVMELETQNQICNRQIKRMDEERSRLREAVEEGGTREKELQQQIRELERKAADLETKKREDVMMARIKDAEHSQTIAEMRQRIAELEIENQELVTAGQLREKGGHAELENRITDLQEEILQLKMAKRLQSISSLALNHLTLDTESDYDTDDLESTLTDTHRLRLKTSIGPEDAHKLKLTQDADSSDGEGFQDYDDGTIKRRTSKKKRKSHLKSTDSVDKDNEITPTLSGLTSQTVDRINGDTVNMDDENTPTVPSSPSPSLSSSSDSRADQNIAATPNGNLHLSTMNNDDKGVANGSLTTSSDTGSSG